MTLLLQAQGLVSREEKYRALHSQFSSPKPYAIWTILGFVVVLACIPLFLKLLHNTRQRRRTAPRHRPRRLLWKLAAHASLGWWDRLVLLRMTQHGGCRHPAAVLISPSLFDRLAREWTEAGGSGVGRLPHIRRQLFPDE